MNHEGSSANPTGTAPPLLNERYEVGERLAEGTFFFTYRGRDTQSGRAVAIKVLKSEFAADETFTGRLLSEAQSAIHLRHPNIAEVYEAWLERGTVVIVTEWVRGINLKDRIRRVAPFPLAVAIDILLAAAEALSYAHQAGFTHGDVRPDNVIITPDGRVKITDFGVGVGVAASSRIQLNALPQAAYYMSPEVAEGRMPTAATDVYALGCILYEMLAGMVPFDAESPLAVAVKHLHDPPPSLKKTNPAVPNAVDGIALKCMQKNPKARYVQMEELLQDIQSVREALRTDRPLTWSPLNAAVENPPVAEKQRTRARSGAAPPRSAPLESRKEAAVDGGPSIKLLAFLAFLAVAMIVSAFGLVIYITRAPGQVAVPMGLVGMKEADAIALLKRYRLTSQVRQDFNDAIAAGLVFDSQPKAGTEMREGKEVVLFVSQGNQPVIVPDIVGKDLNAAEKEVRSAGLNVGTLSEQFSEVIPKGQVMAQDPAAEGKVPKKSSVALTVSKGREPLPEAPPVQVDSNKGDNGGQPREEETPAEPTPPESPADPVIRDHVVTVTVPKSATGNQRVRIVVHNEDGSEETPVDEDHQPGDVVQQTVTTTGAKGKCQVRVYINGRETRRIPL